MASFTITVSAKADPNNSGTEVFEAEDAVTAAFHAGVRAAANMLDNNFFISGFVICETLEGNSTVTVTEI